MAPLSNSKVALVGMLELLTSWMQRRSWSSATLNSTDPGPVSKFTCRLRLEVFFIDHVIQIGDGLCRAHASCMVQSSGAADAPSLVQGCLTAGLALGQVKGLDAKLCSAGPLCKATES